MIKYIIFSILFVILVVIIFIAVSDIRFRKIKNVTYTIESEKIKKSFKNCPVGIKWTVSYTEAYHPDDGGINESIE
mgnify:CR=1 FL=1